MESCAITPTDKFSWETDEIVIASNRNIKFTRWYTRVTGLLPAGHSFVRRSPEFYIHLLSLVQQLIISMWRKGWAASSIKFQRCSFMITYSKIIKTSN